MHYIQPTTVIKRMPAEPNTWTGLGFMQVYEGSDLIFDIPSIFRDLDYDLVIRHEHLANFPNKWENAKATLIYIDEQPDGKCANKTELDGNGTSDDPFTQETSFSMDPSGTYTIIEPEFCLEEGKRYQVKFNFDQYDPATPNSKASILIDAIAFVPRTESLEIFDGSPRSQPIEDQFNGGNCRELFLEARPVNANIAEECQDPLKSVSMYSFEGGFSKACNCDNTGSMSSLCDKYSGQCPCKKNVAGRRCSRCAPGFYGFGANGCQPCNCHNQGALDFYCRETDGQCICADNAFGRRCNECQPGYWNFPNCQPCECNGHTDTCDPLTGECVDCRSNTAGFHCEICLDGYYGDPTLEANIQCKACPCPNTKESGHSFADRCTLDPASQLPICECQREYDGNQCEKCADNYFGNPEVPGGSCVPCDCSNNWNFNATGNCDGKTGICLKCQFNTEGDHCEHCKDGYFGDAVNEGCNKCQCNLLGTDKDNFDCDRVTGKCNCLPNVEGDDCSSCAPDHWKLGSGEGCEYCDCDPIGSTNSTCNVYTGECQCKDGFGGRRCNECKENYFGNPRTDTCRPCNCSPLGSKSLQCDRTTGKCDCLEGIGGKKCDQCDRGFVQRAILSKQHPVLDRTIPPGELQDCAPCGECFANWDRILSELLVKTEEQVRKAEQVKVTGATGFYSNEFEDMEKKLIEIKSILTSADVSNDEIVSVQSDIDRISNVLSETSTKLNGLDGDLASIQSSILQGKSSLDYLKTDAEGLKLEAQEMKDEITALQETNVQGALNLTREAKLRSEEAAAKVSQIKRMGGDLQNSAQQRVATERLMNRSRIDFESTQRQNEDALEEITNQIRKLDDKIPDLNKEVCDGVTSRDEPCDSLCGGAGCGKCGGLSCLDGALSKASEAVSQAENTRELLSNKHETAERVLYEVRQARQISEGAANQAQAAYNMANQAKERSMGEMARVSELGRRIDEFNSNEQATPEDVKALAEECLNAEMTMDNTKIEELAGNINSAISGVSNVDEILAETSDDLNRAETLRDSALAIKDEAEKQLAIAENVTRHLSEASEAQNQADIRIQTTQTDIDSARIDLSTISVKMGEATNAADRSEGEVAGLSERLKKLQSMYITNDNHVKKAQDAAEKARKEVSASNEDFYPLNAGYIKVNETLKGKTELIGSAKDRAMELQRLANSLANSASNKLGLLIDIEKEFDENESRLTELSSQLVELNCQMKIHLDVIEKKSNFYRSCTPTTTWSPSTTCSCEAGSPEPVCVARRSTMEVTDY